MLKPRKPTSSPAVIMLFWTMALVLLATVVSGLRVSAVQGLMQWHGAAIPRSLALSTHLAACLMLAATCVIFLQRQRAEPGLRRSVPARGSWHRADALLSQAFFALVGLETAAALALALGGGIGLARLHLVATVFLIGIVPLHVLMQASVGGLDQLMRMLRPHEPVRQPAPLGQDPGRHTGWRSIASSPRLFGLGLGLAFGAAAASALVSGTSAADRRADRGGPITVAWQMPAQSMTALAPLAR